MIDLQVSFYDTAKIQFPINISKEEAMYLLKIYKSNVCLKVLREDTSRTRYISLRGRKYAHLKNREQHIEFTDEIPTKSINNLIEKGYLVSVDILNYYFYIVPNRAVVSYLLNKNTDNLNKIFEVSDGGKKLKAVSLIDEIDLNDYIKQTNIKEGDEKRLGYLILKAGLPLGLDHKYLYALIGYNHMYIVVSPRGSQVNILVKKEGEKHKKVPLEVTLSSDQIKISSEKYATSYINCTRSNPINLQEIEKDLKKAYKLLTQHKIRTKEKAKNLSIVKDPEYIESVNNFNRLSEQYWKELSEKSKQLVEEGIVFGGLEKNPLYKEAWEIQNKINKLRLDPKIQKLASIQRKISDLEYYSEENLEDCSLYVIH